MSSDPEQPANPSPSDAEHLLRSTALIEQIRESLAGLQYGTVTIVVQDGVVVQIDRTEKRRLQSRRRKITD